MAVDTYYFDGSGGVSDPNNVWTNDANAFNGSTANYAETTTVGDTSANFLRGNGTTAPTSGTTITQVRCRMHSVAATGAEAVVYTSGLGESLGTVTVGSGAGSYTTLSTPTGGWTWQKVHDLEIKIYCILLASQVARAQVEVTSDDPVASTGDMFLMF